jgi:DNA-binding transcriptional LysR family regulator
MITAWPDDILRIVAEGQADIGVCGGLATRPRPPRVAVDPWKIEPYGLFMRAGLAVRQGVQTAIYTINGMGEPISRFRELLRDQQIEPAEVRVVASAEVVKGACLAGLGYAFLPLSATELERTAGLFVEALPPEQRFSAPLCVCYTSEPQPRPSVLRFLHVLTDPAQPPSAPIGSAAT